MDGLSAAASPVSFLQLLAEVIKYVSTATGATKDRKRLREEVRVCSNILQQLKDDVDDSEEGKAWSETVKVLEAADAPLGRLYAALQTVKTQLQTKNSHSRALKWPFQEKEVEKIISTIEREKSLLSLALENNSRKLLQGIIKRSK